MHTPDSSLDDATLDSPAARLRDRSQHAACQHVALVEGSGPQITVETENLLRVRLRAAALSLFLGLGAFLVWRLVRGQIGDVLFDAQLAVVVILGICWVSLRRRCEVCLKSLRFYEIVIFAAPALFMLLLEQKNMMHCATQNYLQNPVAPWYALIFTYALFIPNTWRRAAVAIGCMALAPLVLVGVMWYSHTLCSDLLMKNPTLIVEMTMMLALAFTTSVYGTHMIGSLRREAFEARRLGQYRLLRLIGSGGMGEVYLAEHQMMKRPCAIKLIRPNKANDPQALARFEREVQATAKLSHWNSIEIFDYGRADDGTFYYVMEYLPGLSLAQLVEQYGPLSPARVVYLLRQVCDALGEAHGMGLIHRDLKPGNIFAAIRGGYYDVAKLLDFGLAKPLSDLESVQLTQAGSITGSPLYMSPEQATGDNEPDQRSDIYSLGAVAYYLLTGMPPFSSDQPLKVIVAHASQQVTPPTHLRSEIPADLEAIVLRCLAKRPADRFADASGLAAALADCGIAGSWSREQAARWWRDHERPGQWHAEPGNATELEPAFDLV